MRGRKINATVAPSVFLATLEILQFLKQKKQLVDGKSLFSKNKRHLILTGTRFVGPQRKSGRLGGMVMA